MAASAVSSSSFSIVSEMWDGGRASQASEAAAVLQRLITVPSRPVPPLGRLLPRPGARQGGGADVETGSPPPTPTKHLQREENTESSVDIRSSLWLHASAGSGSLLSCQPELFRVQIPEKATTTAPGRIVVRKRDRNNISWICPVSCLIFTPCFSCTELSKLSLAHSGF